MQACAQPLLLGVQHQTLSSSQHALQRAPTGWSLRLACPTPLAGGEDHKTGSLWPYDPYARHARFGVAAVSAPPAHSLPFLLALLHQPRRPPPWRRLEKYARARWTDIGATVLKWNGQVMEPAGASRGHMRSCAALLAGAAEKARARIPAMAGLVRRLMGQTAGAAFRRPRPSLTLTRLLPCCLRCLPADLLYLHGRNPLVPDGNNFVITGDSGQFSAGQCRARGWGAMLCGCHWDPPSAPPPAINYYPLALPCVPYCRA